MAAFMLFTWPLVTLTLFARLGPERGLIWSTLAGYLLLPTKYGFDLLGLPAYDKDNAVSFSLILAAIVFRDRFPARTGRDTAKLLRFLLIGCTAMIALGMVFTVLDNRGAFTVLSGRQQIRYQGMGLRDLISMLQVPLFAFIPFILAIRLLDTPELHRQLVLAATLAGIFYGLLVLFEWRMSPQLNSWIYGYFAHGWRQHVRSGGFRSIVFLEHGLAVGFFLFSALMAALGGFLAVKGQTRVFYMVALGWIFLALILSRNLGAVMIATALGGTLMFAGRRMALWVAFGIVLTFFLLPALRQSGILTFDTVIVLAERINADRAASFAFRLSQENTLLAHALEKPLFGWGLWGRSRGVEEVRTVTDGLWIIRLGVYGWVGYLSYFGLLALPILALPFLTKRREIGWATVALALIGAGNFVYLIPNSTLSPIAFMMFGALAGLALRSYPSEAENESADVPDPRSGPRYTRFPEGIARAAPKRVVSRPRETPLYTRSSE